LLKKLGMMYQVYFEFYLRMQSMAYETLCEVRLNYLVN